MELPVKLLEALLAKISDPFFIVMLLIIFWLFRMLDKRDQNITEIKTTLTDIVKNQGSILTLMEVLVYNRRKAND